MTNIVGGNAGNIPHFDQGSDGISINGTSKNKSGDFFDLISMLTDSSVGSDNQLSNVEKPFKQAELVSGSLHNHLKEFSSQKLASGKASQSDFDIKQMMSIIEEFQFLQGLETNKTSNSSVARQIDGSTVSQISGMLNTPIVLSELDIQAQIKTLLNSISSELDKLQLGRDFLAIQNSETGFININQEFLGLLEKFSADKSDLSKISEFLKERLHPEILKNVSKSPSLQNNTQNFVGNIKSLPFNDREDGSLLLDLSELTAMKADKTEIALMNNLYLNKEHMTDRQFGEKDQHLDAISLELNVSSKGLSLELSNINQVNLLLLKEKYPLENLRDLSSVSINLPNRNLGLLNIAIKIESSQDIELPKTLAILNFDGSQDVAQVVQQGFDLNKSENLVLGVNNDPIPKLIAELGAGEREMVVDHTHIVKSITTAKNQNSIMDISRMVSSDLDVIPELNLIDKINLNEINSPNFARFLRDKLQFAVNSVTHKINFKQEIAKFIEKSGATLIIQEVATKVAKKELGLDNSINPKKELFLSSADVISYRQAISSKTSSSNLIPKSSLNEISKISTENFDLTLASVDEQFSSGQSLRFNNSVKTNAEVSIQPTFEQNATKAEVTIDRSSNIQSQTFSQRISLLESQFSTRLANSLLEQAINSRENFDLVLEPESFGKVRVNVSVDSSQIDVKLIAENSATLAILRASESMLQSISEQNGLKLAEYNVELNNNAQNNEGSNGRKDGKDQKNSMNEGVENLEETQDLLDQNDSVHSLNLIA